MGKVPELIMSGEMSDVSQFCQFEWFEWAMFLDETAPYPHDNFKLGRHLSQSIDNGPTLIAKISKRMVRSFIGPQSTNPRRMKTGRVQS